MLIKFISVIILSLCAWFFGKNYSDLLIEKIHIVEEYILFSKELKSAVYFSGKNVYEFFKNNKLKATENFCTFLINNKTIEIMKSIKKFKPINNDEKICVDFLYEPLVFIENSSDTEVIAELLNSASENLLSYKLQIQEEYKGRIKTAPSITLICGLFIALVLI